MNKIFKKKKNKKKKEKKEEKDSSPDNTSLESMPPEKTSPN